MARVQGQRKQSNFAGRHCQFAFSGRCYKRYFAPAFRVRKCRTSAFKVRHLWSGEQ
ncbi:hypothetical protein GGTG_05699 [Gaeumannomyces tritici R3-111a-1]|uniref:Uncharacterized protein n=1 Tax=Gaeumannomyces tritici (strain R3-111a-1) TaxID=644352 RepID=J3NWN7_GAET3|nr:hypothetical protein GGTG_05699 [Gaeumannomyces tritici R3-111a-1]EJT75769.1 hypothetical protein GGTG_05699 [Gaeumannomyces tritici R3-111a-1]